ncbi:MAG: hypothetical protein ACRDLP_01925 [Solirubrobacteraceae bacterium]
MLAFPALALAAKPVSTETYAALQNQIATRQVTLAYVDEETHDVHVTLKDGTRQLVVYPAADHKALIDSLLHHGVKPIYTKHTHAAKPVHHVLRYIAAGVVVVLLLVGAGVWMYTRGPRKPPHSSDDTAQA